MDYTVAPEVTDELRDAIVKQLAELKAGYTTIVGGRSKIELLQGVKRVEDAARRLKDLAPRLR